MNKKKSKKKFVEKKEDFTLEELRKMGIIRKNKGETRLKATDPIDSSR